MATTDMITAVVHKDGNAQVAAFGANGKVPQAAVAASPVATVLADTITLANNIRTALIACGILV